MLASTIVAGSALAAFPAIAQDAAQSTNPSISAPTTTASATAANSGSEIVVTGSRITNPNITAMTPVTVVTAATIKSQGNVRIEDMLNSLPQVFASEGSTDANGASGIATVDLRDLGPSRTLVLINGRRLGAGDPTDIAADLNFIPGSLIKRIDVLTGGASATYGSDALGGVVNFVMNTDFEGFQLDAQTSFYNHNNNFNNQDYNDDLAARNFVPPKGNTVDGATKTITATFGASADDGRAHITGYVGWRRVNAVTQGDRDFSYGGFSAETSSGSPYHTVGGSSTSAFGRFRRTQNTGLGSTPVYSAFGTSYTANPVAQGAGGSYGTYSSARDGYNFNPTNYFQRPDTRITAGLFANYDVSDAFKPYMEFMFMDDHTRAQIAASGAFYGTDFFINCNNPLMTSAQQSQLCGANAGTSTLQSLYIGRRNVEGGGRIDDLRHTDYRAVIGAKGEIADGVTYDAYGQYWKSILSEEYLNDFSRSKINNALNVVTDANGNPVCASTLPNAQGQVTDASCVPWNIFTGTTTVQGSTTQGVTQAALNYLQTPGFQHGSNTEYVASGTISVDLGRHGVQLPWASSGVQFVVGGEYRKEQIELQRDVEFLTGDLAGQGTPFGVPNVKGEYDVKEAFTEVQIPLVNDKPFIDTLALDAGYRYSSYSVQGTTNTYKVDVTYAPVKQIRFRAGFNRAVRAPNTLELFNAPNVVLFAGSDPCAGSAPSASLAQCELTGVTAAEYGSIDKNPSNQYNQQTAGNVGLKPEKSDTWTAGFVLNPIRNLTLTADFFNIKVKDLISTYGAQFILNQCIGGNEQFCGNIHRSADGSLWTGESYVANPTLNLGSEKTRGVDVSANYKINIGKESSLTFDLTGTYLDQFKINPGGGAAGYDCAGSFGFNYCGTPLPKWRHTARVTYQITPAIGITGAWRFFSGVTNDEIKVDHLAVCVDGEANPDGCVNKRVRKIKPQSYFDLSLVSRLGDNYTLRVGAQNLLDKNPPFLDSNYSSNGSNTYAQVYDSLGRYVYAAIQLNF
jgi:outer membrane receptor protein involved in Fe transport